MDFGCKRTKNGLIMLWKTCYPTAIPGLESYPCSTVLNTVKTHLQLNFMRHVPGLHHLTTRYKLSFWALIYNLIKRSKLAIISLLTTKASVCILSILKKNTTKGPTQRRMPQSSKDLQVPVALEPGEANLDQSSAHGTAGQMKGDCRDFCRKS